MLGPCNDGRLGLTPDSQDFLGLRAGYKCPQSINYRMKGSFAAEEADFIQVRVGYCNQTQLNITYNNTK